MPLDLRTVLIFLLAFLICSSNYGQSYVEPAKSRQFSITVNYDDYTVKTQMLNVQKHIEPDNDKDYLWYSSQKIMETRGGFDGRLLHGTYRSFYLNNQLKEKGQMKYGLRNKEWKYWYANGTLREVINWKNGIKSGPYLLYNDEGRLMARGKFSNNQLHGHFYTYGGGKKYAERKKYRHGREVKKRSVKPKKHKKGIFPADKKPKKSSGASGKGTKYKTKNAENIFHRLLRPNTHKKEAKRQVKKNDA